MSWKKKVLDKIVYFVTARKKRRKEKRREGHSGGDIAPSHAPTLLSSFSILALPPKVCATTQSRNLIGTPSVEKSIG